MPQEMYDGLVQVTRSAAQIGLRLAEQIDEWVRAQKSPDWQRFEVNSESLDNPEVE